MAATFDASLSTPRDEARLAMGDVAAPFLLQDETYDALIDAFTGTTAQYIAIAKALARVCANKPQDVAQGTMRRHWIDRAQFYNDLALRLSREGVDGDDSFESTYQAPVVGQLDGPVTVGMNRLNGVLTLDETTGLPLYGYGGIYQ